VWDPPVVALGLFMLTRTSSTAWFNWCLLHVSALCSRRECLSLVTRGLELSSQRPLFRLGVVTFHFGFESSPYLAFSHISFRPWSRHDIHPFSALSRHSHVTASALERSSGYASHFGLSRHGSSSWLGEIQVHGFGLGVVMIRTLLLRSKAIMASAFESSLVVVKLV
jgi:hypothetical protein